MTAPHRIEIAPHCSLSPRGAAWFLLTLALPTFGLAAVMTVQGYWPVLPFAGLEIGAVAWALRITLERRYRREIVSVSDDEVRVTARDRQHSAEVVFPRHWAQVKLRRPISGLHPSCLTIESHGRWCEVGSFLTEQERHGLAQRLARLIGHVDESPALA